MFFSNLYVNCILKKVGEGNTVKILFMEKDVTVP